MLTHIASQDGDKAQLVFQHFPSNQLYPQVRQAHEVA